MSEAPERIWAWWDDAYDVGLLNKHGDKRYTPNDAKEYVRADRIEELETQLSEARQVGKEWFEEQKKARKDANAAEAKLAKAIDFVAGVAGGFKFGESLVDWANLHVLKARTLLAELKGETDE
ncbi:gp13 [Roseobacter phage SIO1]|uniref:Gp13 n=1 Tax=Roseobacter phage SIO1 TaxID=2905867 RepID=Q9G0H2_9CAUD|nr:gp13 [Roseobacter phage SIO1]AAG02596.1 gp13 [Roseobacter phage SIO1]